jgi:hypothetical protein
MSCQHGYGEVNWQVGATKDFENKKVNKTWAPVRIKTSTLYTTHLHVHTHIHKILQFLS